MGTTLEERVVAAVIKDLRSRAGLLDGVEEDVIANEITPELAEVVRQALREDADPS